MHSGARIVENDKLQTIHCPTCGREQAFRKLADIAHFPFCSERCKMLDLGRWLDGDYGIPADDSAEYDEQENA
jgi:hypothetical protein